MLNPTGRNQWTKDAEQAEAFRAVVRALNEAPAGLAEPLIRELFELITDAALRRDRFLSYRVASYLLDSGLVEEQRELLAERRAACPRCSGG